MFSLKHCESVALLLLQTGPWVEERESEADKERDGEQVSAGERVNNRHTWTHKLQREREREVSVATVQPSDSR